MTAPKFTPKELIDSLSTLFEPGDYSIEDSEALYGLSCKVAEHQLTSRPQLLKTHHTEKALMCKYQGYNVEVFGMMLLDNQHRIIEIIEVGQGTIDAMSVYPREVIKLVLQYDAKAVILFHNHPSGSSEPSSADDTMTYRLQAAFNTIDVRLLDHVVLGKGRFYSYVTNNKL